MFGKILGTHGSLFNQFFSFQMAAWDLDFPRLPFFLLLFHNFSAFFFPSCKSFLGRDFDVFLHSLPQFVLYLFFCFCFIPNVLLILFLDVLTTGKSQKFRRLRVNASPKYYSESQSEIVFPADHLFRPILLYAVFSPASNFSSCDQYSNLSVAN